MLLYAYDFSLFSPNPVRVAGLKAEKGSLEGRYMLMVQKSG